MQNRVASGMLALFLGVLGSGLIAPTPVRAETSLWTVTATPLVATTGTETTFILTATNQDPTAALLSSSEIGCLIMSVPGNFSVAASAVTGSNAGASWTSTLAGNSVWVSADSGGDRLTYLQWVSFTVRATPTSVGLIAWDARAYRSQDCSGSGTALGVPPVVVVSDPTVSPTLTPTPTPTPPLPSLPPAPSQALPTPTPTVPIDPDVTPTPGPSESGTGQPAEDPQPPANAGGAAGTPASPRLGRTSMDAPDASGPRIAFDDEAGFEAGLATGSLLNEFGAWQVPVAALSGPGLIILIWVAVQTAGALAWIPAVHRLRGEDTRPVT